MPKELATRTLIDDGLDIDALGTTDLMELRVELREHISRQFAEKARLGGILRALEDGEAVGGAGAERTLRHQRRLVNLDITAKSALLDRVKLRLFALQPTPRPKSPPTAPPSTADERAARLAALDRDGPDGLLLRAMAVLRRHLDATGTDTLSEDDRRTLGDLSFYVRQKYGKGVLGAMRR